MLREKINKIFSSKTFYLVFSIIAAILLWFYVSGVENKDDDIVISNISVNFMGREDLFATQSLIVNDDYDYTVTLQIMGKRNTLSKLNKSNVAVNVDLSDIKAPGFYNRLFSVVLPSNIDTSDIYIKRSPEYLTVKIEKYIIKPVEVKGLFDEGSVKDGYMAEPLIFNPASVQVGGVEDVVSRIAYAWVVMEQKDIDHTVTQALDYVFMDQNGNTVPMDKLDVDVEKVDVTLPIVMVKDVKLAVRVVPGGGATEENLQLTINPQVITVSGDAATLEDLDEIILDTFILSNITEDISRNYSIPIPEGLKNLSGETEAAVSASITGLASKKLVVSNIQFTNVSTGYTATSVTQYIEITVRGPQKSIDRVKASDITLIADLSDLGQTTGRYSVKAGVYINGYADAGAVGEYYVVVSLGT